MIKPGDICEIVQGPFPLSSWNCAHLIGMRVTIVAPDPSLPVFYIVKEISLWHLHEKTLRKLPPDEDYLSKTSWDKCVWQPRVRA